MNNPTNYEEKARAHAKAERLVKAAAGGMLDALEGLYNIITHPKATRAQIRMIAEEARPIINKAKGI